MSQLSAAAMQPVGHANAGMPLSSALRQTSVQLCPCGVGWPSTHASSRIRAQAASHVAGKGGGGSGGGGGGLYG